MIEFGVFAALAGHVGKSLVLDIEEFAEKAACGANLAYFVGSVSAFRAGEMNIFTHFIASLLLFRLYNMSDNFTVSIFNGVAKDQKIGPVEGKTTGFSALKESEPNRKNICRKEIIEKRIITE